MPVQIRKAVSADLDAVALIYSHIHTEEEQGRAVIGWQRGVYPERETAEKALERDDLFVEELDGVPVGTAIINQQQVDVYAGAPWEYEAPEDRVMVLHTLVIDPQAPARGLGRAFVAFYEQYARESMAAHIFEWTPTFATSGRGPFIKSWAIKRSRWFPACLTG